MSQSRVQEVREKSRKRKILLAQQVKLNNALASIFHFYFYFRDSLHFLTLSNFKLVLRIKIEL